MNQLRRLMSTKFISKRRQLFNLEEWHYDGSINLPAEDHSSESIIVPLETHSIGTYGPSLIPFNEGLLKVLACPISGGPLMYDKAKNLLVSETAGVAFPINKAGFPIFLKKWAIFIDDSNK